jgi:hypothetical protein
MRGKGGKEGGVLSFEDLGTSRALAGERDVLVDRGKGGEIENAGKEAGRGLDRSGSGLGRHLGVGEDTEAA